MRRRSIVAVVQIVMKRSRVMLHIIFNYLQARKLLRELKHQKRCNEAATIIAAYWHGTQVRKQ